MEPRPFTIRDLVPEFGPLNLLVFIILGVGGLVVFIASLKTTGERRSALAKLHFSLALFGLAFGVLFHLFVLAKIHYFQSFGGNGGAQVDSLSHAMSLLPMAGFALQSMVALLGVTAVLILEIVKGGSENPAVDGRE